jgi:hypothetical protein
MPPSRIGTSAPAKLRVWRIAAVAFVRHQVPEVGPGLRPTSQRAGLLAGAFSAVTLPARLFDFPLRRRAELAALIAFSTARTSSRSRAKRAINRARDLLA